MAWKLRFQGIPSGVWCHFRTDIAGGVTDSNGLLVDASLVALIGDDGIAPHVGQWSGLVGRRIEVDHDGSASGLERSGVAVDQMLQEREALVSQAGTLGEHFDRLLEHSGLDK